MNTNITNMIQNFAKSNKVSRVKVENLVLEALKASGALKVHQKRGRKPNGLNKNIENMAKNFETFTVVELMSKFNVSRPTIVKAIEDCQKNGVISPLGKMSTGKGRNHTVWGISSSI